MSPFDAYSRGSWLRRGPDLSDWLVHIKDDSSCNFVLLFVHLMHTSGEAGGGEG